jgi:hypothetical protein
MKELEPTYFYPNVMGRILLLAMEEILGRSDVEAVLNRASLPHYIRQYPSNDSQPNIPFGDISRIQSALEEEYGPRAGRGLALRTGRACFKYGLREFGTGLGLTDLAFRLLPLSAKLKTGSNALAGLFSRYGGQRVRVEFTDKNIFWRVERCSLCWQRQASEPVCYLTVGLLQEALYWVSGGKTFHVTETQCLACGDASCTIVIDRNPLA